MDVHQQGEVFEILPEDVPVGDSAADIEERCKIISRFYHDWKLRNQSLRKFNLSLLISVSCLLLKHVLMRQGIIFRL